MDHERLTRDEVAHVADLARIALDDDELAEIGRQLNDIVERFGVLASLDTEGIEPTDRPIDEESTMRVDEVRPSLPVDAALANAAERHGDHVVVPVIIDESTRG